MQTNVSVIRSQTHGRKLRREQRNTTVLLYKDQEVDGFGRGKAAWRVKVHHLPSFPLLTRFSLLASVSLCIVWLFLGLGGTCGCALAGNCHRRHHSDEAIARRSKEKPQQVAHILRTSPEPTSSVLEGFYKGSIGLSSERGTLATCRAEGIPSLTWPCRDEEIPSDACVIRLMI